MQSQGTERTRSDNDIVAGRRGRRAPEGFAEPQQADLPAPADPRHSRRMPKPPSPGQRGSSRRPQGGQPAPQTNGQAANGQPNNNGSASQSSPRVAGLGGRANGQPPRQQPPTGRAEAPRRGQPRADRLPPPPAQQSGRHPAPSQWDTQPSVPRVDAPRPDGPRSERLRPAGSAPNGQQPPNGSTLNGIPTNGAPVNGAPNGAGPNGNAPRNGTNSRIPMGTSGRMPVPPPPPPGDALIANRLAPDAPPPAGPPSLQGMQPVGPVGSRPGMPPVGAPSRPGMPAANRPPMTPLAAAMAEAKAAPRVERREDIDPTCLTTEMEPISEAVEQKRKVDATLARFSAVHDEMAEEERQRRSKRIKLMPWLAKDDDLEEALTTNGPVSPASAGKSAVVDEDHDEDDEPRGRSKVPLSRLQAKIDAKRGKNAMTAKIAAGVAAALVLVLGFYGWRSLTGGNSGGNNGSGGIQEVAALDENSPAILQATKQYADSNFLLVGTSSRPGAAAAAAQATDTMMAIHIPADGSRAEIVSFPPNMVVNRPACQQWNNQTSQASGDVPAQDGVKLSSVYATGGPRCVTDTVQQLTGLRINHFVGVDTAGFGDLVNSIQGGVPMCVKAPVKDTALGTVVPAAGPVTLSGSQALNFVTADQVQGDTQPEDLSRIQRQQRFLAAAVRKLVQQQNLLMSASQLNTFLGTFTRATFGDNMGVDQLAKLATSLQGLAIGKITFITLPTGAPNAAGEEAQDATNTQALFKAIIDNSPMPGETQASAGATAAQQVAPSGVKLQVMNGENGTAASAASTTATQLRNLGFMVTNVDNTATTAATVIKYSAPQQAQAQLLGSAVPSAKLQVDPTMGGAIELVLGADFDHRVQAPKAGGTAPTGPASEAPAGLSYVNAGDTSCA